MLERRIDPRLDIPLPAEFQLTGEEPWREGTLQNLSAGGAAVLVDEALDDEAAFARIRFTLPAEDGETESELDLAAFFVRSWAHQGAGSSTGRVLAVQFVELGDADFKRIQRFVFNRLTKGPVDEASAADRIAFKRPIAVRFNRFGDFVNEVSENLSETGMFIRTRDPRPPGSVFRFEFRLGDDFTLVEGRAQVVWNRRVDGGPKRPFGMGVKFLDLDETSKSVIRRLVQQQRDEEAGTKADPASGPRPVPIGAPLQELAATGPTVSQPASAPAAAAAASAAPDPEAPPTSSVESGTERGSQLEAQLLKLRTDYALLERELTDERAALEDERQRAADHETALQEEQEQVAELRQQLDATTSERDGLSEELGDAIRERDEIRPQLETAEEKQKELEGRLAEAEGALEETKGASGRSEQELAEVTEQITALERKLEKAEAKGRELESELGKARDREAAAGKELTESQPELEKLRGQVSFLEGELQIAGEKEKGLRDRIDEIQVSLADSDSAREGLSGKLEGLSAERDELDEKNRALEETNKSVANQLEEANVEWSRSLEEARRQEADAREELERALTAENELREQWSQAAEEGAAPLPAPQAAEGGGRRLRAAGLVAAGALLGLLLPFAYGKLAPTMTADAASAAPPLTAEAGAASTAAESATTPASPEPTAPPGQPSAPKQPSPTPTAQASARPVPDATVRSWAAAWSGQDVDAYLSFYAAGFLPDSGMARAEWTAQRRERLRAPASIQVTLGALETAALDEGRVQVSFDQAYATPTYQDEVRKTLELAWEKGAWRIASETSRPL